MDFHQLSPQPSTITLLKLHDYPSVAVTRITVEPGDFEVEAGTGAAPETRQSLQGHSIDQSGAFTFRQELIRVRALEPLSDPAFTVRRLGDTGMANKYERAANLARIVVLVAVALPVFGALYYALLDFLLFG